MLFFARIIRRRLEASYSFQKQKIFCIVNRIKVSQQLVYILLVFVEQGFLEVGRGQDCLSFLPFLIYQSLRLIRVGVHLHDRAPTFSTVIILRVKIAQLLHLVLLLLVDEHSLVSFEFQ